MTIKEARHIIKENRGWSGQSSITFILTGKRTPEDDVLDARRIQERKAYAVIDAHGSKQRTKQLRHR